jgi:hypothetical protein
MLLYSPSYFVFFEEQGETVSLGPVTVPDDKVVWSIVK